MRHLFLLLKPGHRTVKTKRQRFRQRQKPVEIVTELTHFRIRHSHVVETLDKSKLPCQTSLVVSLRLHRLQVSHHETRKRVGAALQGLQLIPVVQQLDGPKVETHTGAQEGAGIVLWAPRDVRVAQDRQTGDGTLPEQVQRTVAVLEHAQREAAL